METVTSGNVVYKNTDKRFWRRLYSERFLYLMSLPFVVWVVIFKYIPIWGWVTAFQEYRPGRGFFEQEWVGLKHFQYLFHDPQFYRVLRNTLAMSVLSLIVNFVLAITFAVFINEIKNAFFKRTIQTVSYLPHFVSWVIIAGMFSKLLSTDDGLVNNTLIAVGLLDEPVQFMAKGEWFWAIATIVEAWKETGWNSIIYLAAISGINPELYEAAIVDGAGRFKRIWHVTLPCIRPTIVVMLVMCIGWLVSNGFEKQFLMGNNLVIDYSQVIQMYVLQYGIGMGRFSFGTAVGIFRSLVSIILLLFANYIARKYNEGNII